MASNDDYGNWGLHFGHEMPTPDFESMFDSADNAIHLQDGEESLGLDSGEVMSPQSKPLPHQSPASLDARKMLSQQGFFVPASSPESMSQDSSSESSRSRKRKMSSGDSSSAGADVMQTETPTWNAQEDQNSISARPSSSGHNGQSFHASPDILNGPGSFAYGLSASNSPEYYDASHQGRTPSADGPSILRTVEQESTGDRNASQILDPSRDPSPASQAFFSSHSSPLATAHQIYTQSPRNTTLFSSIPYSHFAWLPRHPSGPPIYPFFRARLASPKSRVETQVSCDFILDNLPYNYTWLHLPPHAISKAKQQSKTPKKGPEVLELSAQVVCASAMRQEGRVLEALARALNAPPPVKGRPASTKKHSSEGDPNDPEKPANGGPVEICSNCIMREQKRVKRRKNEKKEEDQLWIDWGYDRTVVFNDKEYLELQPLKKNADGLHLSPAAKGVSCPVRITCYCRHQGEKYAFQIIFTLKDYAGNPVAQCMTEPLTITDDHKTQPTALPDKSSAGSREGDAQPSVLTQAYNSATDLPSVAQTPNVQPLTMSSPQPQAASQSQPATSPQNLSRQASPSVQHGSNKRRKPSSPHQTRLPTSLTMTRVDAPQASGPPNVSPPAPASASISGKNPFAPSGAFFVSPPGMPGVLGSGPTQFPDTQPPVLSNGANWLTRSPRNSSFESVPSFFATGSTFASRSGSPAAVLAPQFGLMPPSQSDFFFPTAISNAAAMDVQPQQQPPPPQPTISKIIPAEGSKSGGIEVTILGRGFAAGMEVMFGEHRANGIACWGESTIVCVLPPSAFAGPVPVRVISGSAPSQTSASFRYLDDETKQLYEMALLALFQKTQGSSTANGFQDWARNVASSWGSGGSSGGHSFGAGMQHSLGLADAENVLLKCLDAIDLDESENLAQFDNRASNGVTMLHLACSLGFNRVVAGLVARGADLDIADNCGFTPLMMAALNGHAQIVRRLILRGADPCLRSLRGYVAEELTTNREVINALRHVPHHRRARSAGALSSRSRASSLISSRTISSPTSVSGSEEAEETEESTGSGKEPAVTRPEDTAWIQSRRNSVAVDVTTSVQHPTTAAMHAWGNQVLVQMTTQIEHFQNTLNRNLPHFQLPIPQMPALPGYQARPMVRRISSLVPSRTPSPAPASADELPSYSEVCPARVDHGTTDQKALKRASTQQALQDAVADELLTRKFDNAKQGESSKTTRLAPVISSAQSEGSVEVKIGKTTVSKEQQEQLRMAHARKLKKIRSDRNLFFVWIPLLILLIVMFCKDQIAKVWGVTTAVVGPVVKRWLVEAG